MLLTVPVLYYKPIQEPALKINKGTKKKKIGGRRNDRQVWGSWGREVGVEVRGTHSSKAGSFMFKGTFFVSLRDPDAILKQAETVL